MRLATVTLIAGLLAGPVLGFAQTPAPATKPAPAATAAPTKAAAPATATPAGSADEASAKQKCGTDPVVWSNPGSKAYHTSDSRYYGKTKKGAYMCLKDATAAGYHASKSSVAHAKKPASTS